MLTRFLIVAAALCASAIPTAGRAAVTETAFQVRTTADLVELCSAAPAEAMGTAALNFCHGFAAGVYHVLQEENAAKRVGHLFCVPEANPPTRDAAIADFVVWAKAKPDILSQRPANGLTAYLMNKYPCPRGK